MKCCVPFCNISKNTLNSQKVTYHKFPVEKYRRAAWCAALGLEENQLLDVSVVCSLHFKDSDFYNGKIGLKIVQRGAVPFVQVCMICLDTNCKLYPLAKYNLEKAYETLTGLYLQQIQSCLTPTVCSECAQRLTNCHKFRDKSLRAHILLLDLFKKHESLTVPNIRTINRLNFGLKSNITQKTFKPNHCDLNFIDASSYTGIKLDGTDEKTVVKEEKKDEVFIVIDPKEIKSNELLENDSLTDITKQNIKTDVNDDMDIDIDFLCDENDDGVLNNEDDDDDDGEFLADAPEGLNVKKVNVSLNNLTDGVGFVEKKENENDELKDDKIELPKHEVKNLKRKRKVNLANTKNVRNKTQTTKKTATKKDAPKKRAPKKRAPKTKANSENKSKRTAKTPVLTLFEVTKLSHEEQVEEINKRKNSSNYLNSSFRCDLCYRGFLSKTTHTRHMLKHSKSYGEVQCPVCKQYLKARYALHNHIGGHNTRYSCTVCEFTTLSCDSARMHEFWHKGTTYKCSQCDNKFLKYTSYITHVRVKHPSDYICNQCGYSYLSEKGLILHTSRIHRLDRVEKPEGPLCELCNIRFASEAAHAQHLKVSPKHHTPETRAVNQAVPRRSYSIGPGRSAASLTCEQCGVRLKDYLKYMFHFKHEHPDKERTQYAPCPRAVLCELCGKSCQTPQHLKYHMTKHTGQKDFQCDVCQKRFRLKRVLDMHKETHEPRETRRRYPCRACDKSFTSPSSLYRHEWIHKGKSFKCEICDKAFSNPSERNSHVSHVHMKVPWPKRLRQPSATRDENCDE